MTHADPHAQAVIHHAGAEPSTASAAIVLLHGRGGTAQNMMPLACRLQEQAGTTEQLAFLLPQATANVWYPQSGFLPQSQLEPWLESSLRLLDRLIDSLPAGLPVVLGGFSQGAMLSLEYASHGRRRLAGVLGFSGSFIGPLDPPHAAPTGVDRLRVFLGCGTNDDWIALPFVEATARLLTETGAEVDLRIYDGMDHHINDDEIIAAGTLISNLIQRTEPS